MARVARELRSQPVTMPAPIGGWNTRDAKESMDKTDAVLLDNWYPTTGNVTLRNGYASHATGMTGNVETLSEYNATTVRKLLAAANSNIWDATVTGAASSLASGFTNDRWQTANFNGSQGWVNGEDAPQVYNGSTVTAMTISGTALTVTTLIGINIHKSRSYFWAVNSQDFWYSEVNALGGTLTKFPLSILSQFGGNLTAMGTWTLDAGDGVDDLAVFVMSSGDAIVYQGSDPGDSADWSLVGIYRIGSPLSIRSIIKLGGDLVLGTNDDYVSLANTLRSDRTQIRTKVVGGLQEAVRNYAANFGWQAVVYPKGGMIIFNVPKSGTQFEQHVQNITTKAWCRFKGMNAHCWGIYNDDLYFGGAAGVIYKADTGQSDNGSAIQADAITSWNMLKSFRNKQVTGVQDLLETKISTVNVGTAVGVDFQDPEVGYTETTQTVDSTPWGSAWGSAWSAETTAITKWSPANAYGRYFSRRMRVSSGSANVSWNSYTYLTQTGGVI